MLALLRKIAHTAKHRQTSTGLPLWLEISLILCLKVLAIFVLWKLFFSQPSTKKMRLPTPVVEQHLLSSSTQPAPPKTP
ncbi:cytochrome oxidase putative small subunit CydP [Undibacterium danionis]|uniref:Cytochrome oxidase putative small subunit CydP n=1 Tax=Undibacterium danionis TaxID=1812100 RepID=A0ABV6IJ02_9BURK